ncbi:probable subtilisin-like serine protease [Rhynchosporium agropyri]|uniref:Probable subtilisin-like serine protease n=1 Tax=Rhynchosporium agropyri TaxID=914238 RepID=A0A1E1K131_9HELO|nr:probable subtilisin-like serine protease [Rhynchosporium agropyri]
MRGLIGFALLPLLASSAPTSSSSSFSTETIHEGVAPLISSSNSVEVPDSYIVVFKKHVSEAAASEHHSWVQGAHEATESSRTELRKRSQHDISAGLKHTYNIAGSFLGYSGHFDDEVIEQVRRHPDVEYVEKDSVVHTLGETEGEIEKNAPWGLARISHRKSLGFSDFNKYLYAADGGEGVDVYVIDTGTNTEHVDFEGRAHWGKTIPSGDADEDGNGHGTHCSGTVAGTKYGVAKKANVYAVKVLRSNGSGTMADVVKGVEWAANAHTEKVKKGKKGFKGSAANMSLGGGKSPALDRAVNGAVDAGIHFAVAAGNDNADSCNYSPAAAEKAITVGASAFDDSRAYFSNFGKCNDIFAPGLSILSTWIGSKYATNTISGTSMASPHIAGLLAYYLSLQPASDSEYAVADMTPKKLKESIISIATEGALSDVPSGTKNVLAWNGGGSSNYSSIVEAGSYTVKSSTQAKLPTSIKLLEEAIEKDFNVISGEVVKDTKATLSKAEKISKKMQKIVEAELHELLEEMSS